MDFSFIFPARTYMLGPVRKILSWSSYNKSTLLTKLVGSRWLHVDQVIFFSFACLSVDPAPSWSINTQKKELEQYPAIFTSPQ